MKLMHIVRPAVLLLALAAPAMAQSSKNGVHAAGQSNVTAADIQRLQDQVYDTSNEISRLRSHDQALADQLQSRLDDARDDVVYLRVKMRREGSVNRTLYNDVRGQIDSIRSEARTSQTRNEPTQQGNGTWSSPNQPAANNPNSSPAGNYPTGTGGQTAPRRNEVPGGTELDVRLEKELSSETAQVEDRFIATTMADLYQGNDVLIPAGSTLRGVVSSVNKASRTERKGSVTVVFDQINVRGRSYPIHGTVTQALESEGIKGEAAKIGAGAGVGAIIGGILGGTKGALLGILIGGGGTIAATEGKNVTLPPGTVLRVRMEQPLQIR
jgi:TolA-binding protein